MAHADAAKRILEIAGRFEPKIRRALGAAFEELRGRVTDAAVLEALETGGPPAVMHLLDDVEGVLDSVKDELEESFRESGRAWITTVPDGAVTDGSFRFDPFNPRTADAVREYEFNLIHGIADETREAVRQGLIADVVSGRNPRETARAFREGLGLTPRQEQAVRNYRAALEDGGLASLRRELRDKRSDAAVRRAAEEGEPLPKERIDALVERYRARMLRYRSEVIARTESLRAATVGQQAAVRQALVQRAIDADRLRRFWVYTRDARTRPDHRAIPGMNPDGVALGEAYRTPGGPLMFPRDPSGSGSNTIQCRCAERYSLADAAPPARTVAPPAEKPAEKPAETPAEKPAPPTTPKELRAEYERLRAEAERIGAASGRVTAAESEAIEAASEARVRWARSLSPAELRDAKAEVLREMVKKHPKDVDLSDYETHIRMASGGVPFDTLERMRLKGYDVQIMKASRKDFRAVAAGKHIMVARDNKPEDWAHEVGHTLDSFFSGDDIDRDVWTNKKYAGAENREGYKGIFHSLRKKKRGTYKNGDGELWLGNWISNYEGRIYRKKNAFVAGAVGIAAEAHGLEFWAMNSQRYATYKYFVNEGYDALMVEYRQTVEAAPKSPEAQEARANLRSLESLGREGYSLGVSQWGAACKYYPGISDLMTRVLDRDFATKEKR
jgi:hypothetical protein